MTTDNGDRCDTCPFHKKGYCEWKTPKGTEQHCFYMVLTEEGWLFPEEMQGVVSHGY